ncbi:hypothetical protein Egran_04045 [Elaphomyces granulatus]|uniref:Uncharacterized protein n=1 Tax=Elaphomyces granulatus TaxID=519963 RepID=A0A232LVQ6_9EURO|nr:hypothetical protein Egran_04045 [Elaphomyces granulatus]
MGSICNHRYPPDQSHTCAHSYHSDYSESYLPPLLFQLDPPRVRPREPIEQLTKNGEAVESAEGSPIRNFSFLPRYISAQVPGWLLEYWMRTDGRLTYKDIKARMTARPEELPTENSLNMRREREARGPLGLSCWTNTRTHITRVELKRVECWTIDQVTLNTTMNVEYQRDDPGVPRRLRSKTLANAVPHHYDVCFFLDRGETTHTPSARIKEAIELFHKLSQAARDQGLESWECVHSTGTEVSMRVPKRRMLNVTGILDKNSNVKRIRRSRTLRLDKQTSEDRSEGIEGTDSNVEKTNDKDDNFDAHRVGSAQHEIFSNVAVEEDEHVAFSGLPRLNKNHEYVDGQFLLDRSEAVRSSTHRGSINCHSVVSNWTSINGKHNAELQRFNQSSYGVRARDPSTLLAANELRLEQRYHLPLSMTARERLDEEVTIAYSVMNPSNRQQWDEPYQSRNYQNHPNPPIILNTCRYPVKPNPFQGDLNHVGLESVDWDSSTDNVA